MIKKYKNKLLILALTLFALAFIITVLNGKTYIYKIDLYSNIKSIEELKIEVTPTNGIIKINDIKLDDDNLVIKLESLKPGKAIIDISDGDVSMIESFYVHPLGTITQNTYFGKCSSDIIISLFIIAYSLLFLILLLIDYIRNVKDNMYQYKNITYLGFIIFLSTMILHLFLQMFKFNGIVDILYNAISTFTLFSIIIFPVAFIVSFLIIISNLRLIKKEGLTFRNTLGILLSLLVIFASIFPEILNNYLQQAEFIDVHNTGSVWPYIHDFLNNIIYICLGYLECILLSTIVLSVKAAKHIPEYNKDYIIILGCMIKKDGTLTPLLKGRTDRALEFAKLQKEKTNKDIIFVPSGGQGSNEIISEAEAMKNYLLRNGIKNQNILIEDKSRNTYENIKFSYDLIKKKSENPNCAFSTTNFHVFRAGTIATNQNIKVEGIGSSTKSYFWINAFIREFIAAIYSEKRRHLKIISIIVLLSFLIILMNFISNIIH